jgi:hypothetical protein
MTILQDILAAVGWQARVNENNRSLAPAALYGINPASTSALTLGYLGGQFNGTTVADGVLTLTASATNYVVANRSTGVVTSATDTTNWLNSSVYLQLYQLVAGTATFTIATTSDKRQAIGASGGGGGSGDVVGPAGAVAGKVATFNGVTGKLIQDSGVTLGDIATISKPGGTTSFLRADGTWATPPSTGGGVTVFTGLTDAPPNYTGASLKAVRVNTAATALEFYTPSSGFVNPMTTVGDMIVGGAAGAAARIAAGAINYVWTSNGVGVAPSWKVAGGGGLTNWTEAVASTGINASTPVVSFSPFNAAADVDAVIAPKGGGALLAAIPDGGSGGNKRGPGSVDFQMYRSASSQVASGAYAGILSGNQNTVTASYAVVVSGTNNSAVNNYGVVIGGTTNRAGGYASVILGGSNNRADGDYSLISGRNAADRGVIFSRIFSSTAGGQGYAQTGTYSYEKLTSDATATRIAIDNSAPGTANQVTLPTNGAYTFTGRVVAMTSGAANSKHWTFSGAIVRGSTAASTTLVAAVTPVLIAASAGASGWSIAISADTTVGCLGVTVTGAAATDIKWLCVIDTVELMKD